MMIIITKRWCNKGVHSPVAGYNDFQLCAKNNTSLTYHPTTVGLDNEYWQSLSYVPSTVYGLDVTRLRQRNKMARHKQLQKLGGSHNADLIAPQGVTCQTFIDTKHNTTPLKGGRVGEKITITVCFRAS